MGSLCEQSALTSETTVGEALEDFSRQFDRVLFMSFLARWPLQCCVCFVFDMVVHLDAFFHAFGGHAIFVALELVWCSPSCSESAHFSVTAHFTAHGEQTSFV